MHNFHFTVTSEFQEHRIIIFCIKARTQNITVAVSFGAERDAAFEHAANRCVISMPQVRNV